METPVLPILTPAEVDELWKLLRKKAAWAQDLRRCEALSRAYRLRYVGRLAADQTHLAEGTLGDIQVGQQHIEKHWSSLTAVTKAVGGWQKLLKLATITYSAVAGVTGNAVASALQFEARTGYRDLVAVSKLNHPAAAETPAVPQAA